MAEIGRLIRSIFSIPKGDDSCDLVVAVEGVKHVTILVYFKARANGISRQTGYGVCVREREERSQDDSKVFILSNLKDGIAIPELERL